MPALFQVGLISGLVDGVDQGDIPFKALIQHGDTGIGTLNAGGGHMSAIDGAFYAVDTKGVVSPADLTAMPPFTMVTKFNPAFSFPLGNISGCDSLNAALDMHLPTLNIFYMLRIDAELEWIKLCSESCVNNAESVVPHTMNMQPGFTLKNTRGFLIVTRCPRYGAGITIPGYHYHFMDQEKRRGGHVLDIMLIRAKVWVTPLRRFSLVLFNNENVDETALRSGSAEAIGQANR